VAQRGPLRRTSQAIRRRGRGAVEEGAAPDMDLQITGETGAARDRSGPLRKGESGNRAALCRLIEPFIPSPVTQDTRVAPESSEFP
jgi:hypothetical protein